MPVIFWIDLGVHLVLWAIANAPLIGKDAATLDAIIRGLLAGKQPTQDELNTLASVTAKIAASALPNLKDVLPTLNAATKT